MRLGPTFFVKVLLCLFTCLCNGAPPTEDKTRYTDEEDAFIVEELSNLPDYYIPIQGCNVWKEISKKISEKSQQKTPGFPKERSVTSLRNHIRIILKPKLSTAKVKVPESLIQRFDNPLSNKRGGGGNKRQYNSEEDKLIIEELLKTPSDKLLSIATLKPIKTEHDKRRLAKIHGFEFERSITALHTRLDVMKNTGQLPDVIMKKFNLNEEGSHMSHYNAEEDKLIVEELLKSPSNKLFSFTTLQAIKTEHDKRRFARTPGFENERSVYGIVGRLFLMRNSDLFPDEVMKKLNTCEEGASSSQATTSNQQTDLQLPDEGQDEDSWIADMIQELRNNTTYDIDFRQFDD